MMKVGCIDPKAAEQFVHLTPQLKFDEDTYVIMDGDFVEGRVNLSEIVRTRRVCVNTFALTQPKKKIKFIPDWR